MKESDVQNALYTELFTSCHIIIPNFHPRFWYECDIYAVTKAGYAREYEVKLSRADFKNDKKNKTRKHSRLKERDAGGPTQFYYVVPELMIKKTEIPKYAGLYYIHECGNGGVILMKVKEAPRLSRKKVNRSQLMKICRAFYFRYWNLRRRRNK